MSKIISYKYATESKQFTYAFYVESSWASHVKMRNAATNDNVSCTVITSNPNTIINHPFWTKFYYVGALVGDGKIDTSIPLVGQEWNL